MKTQSSSGGRGRVGVRIVFGDEPTETSFDVVEQRKRILGALDDWAIGWDEVSKSKLE